MTLFWFILGIIIIILISRYNESEKLFWKLLISFIGTFAAASVVCSYIDSKNQDKKEYIKSAPTQALYSGSHNICVLADPSVTVTNEEKSSDPVSKEILADATNSVLCKVIVAARDQPFKFFDTS